MKSSQIPLTFFIIFSIFCAASCLHVQINNIHHGYRFSIEGNSQVIKGGNGDVQIILTELNVQMDQLQPELIPFVQRIGTEKVIIDLNQQQIQGIYEEQQKSILLVFTQHTSIITTLTFRTNSNFPNENLLLVSSTIQQYCPWNQDAL